MSETIVGTDINETTFTGRLGADPVVKTMRSGSRVAKFNIQVEDHDGPFWMSCEGWDQISDWVEANLKCNSDVLVKGAFKVEKWSEEGQKKIKYIVRITAIKKITHE